MPPAMPEQCPYTALFCEENVWWLAHRLAERGQAAERVDVVFLANPGTGVLLLEQRAAAPGQAVIWDYHVILRVCAADGSWIMDPDSRLPCPVRCQDYLRDTFPAQDMLPPDLRSWIRTVPAAAYLRQFRSDRRHMLGRVAQEAFPPYPIIQPAPGVAAVDLAEYLDLRREIPGTELVRSPVGLCACPPLSVPPAAA